MSNIGISRSSPLRREREHRGGGGGGGVYSAGVHIEGLSAVGMLIVPPSSSSSSYVRARTSDLCVVAANL